MSEEIAEYELPGADARDGIGEEDNPIPKWFTISFFATIVFACFYAPYYLFSGWSQVSQYEAEVEVAEAHAAKVRAAMPTTNPYRGDAAAIAEGSEVWATICVACHKPDGSGLVGPSLIDPYWKYGNTDEILFTTVTEGRPLGMPPWGPTLGSEKIWKVLAYMETLPKTDEPGVGSPDYQAPGAPGN
jgi:cytochrome c oxidase cbb3-type subunit 3